MWFGLSYFHHVIMKETEVAPEDITNKVTVQRFKKVFVIIIVDKCIHCNHT